LEQYYREQQVQGMKSFAPAQKTKKNKRLQHSVPGEMGIAEAPEQIRLSGRGFDRVAAHHIGDGQRVTVTALSGGFFPFAPDDFLFEFHLRPHGCLDGNQPRPQVTAWL
jgi:hypothetical protein